MKKILVLVPILFVAFSLKSQITDTVPDIENNCLNGYKYYADSIEVYFANDSVYISGMMMANCAGTHYLIRHTVQDSIYIIATDSCMANCMCPFNFQTVISINVYNEYNLSFGYTCLLYENYFLHYMDTTVYRNNTSFQSRFYIHNLVSIFPNPSNNKISIVGDDITNILIYNEIGNLLYQTRSMEDIDISNFNKGIYIIKIITKEHIISEKFVKE